MKRQRKGRGARQSHDGRCVSSSYAVLMSAKGAKQIDGRCGSSLYGVLIVPVFRLQMIGDLLALDPTGP